MRILLTNDDGIHAEGLTALERIAAELSDDVWICAPEAERSGASRALTLSDPIRVRQLGERRFATSGTPTDCVMLGVRELVEGATPDLVLSGVNRGANLAEDVTLSGTVAGAIEAMALGVKGIALSQMGFHEDGTAGYAAAEAFAPGIIRKLIEVGQVFRITRWAMIRRVMLPAVLPEWIISLRSGLGLGFMFVVAAEFMGASEGLGFLLVDGQQMGKPAQILAAIITFAVLGKLADGVLVMISKPLLLWQDTARGAL